MLYTQWVTSFLDNAPLSAKEKESYQVLWLKNVKQTLIDPKNTFTKILGTSQAFNQ